MKQGKECSCFLSCSLDNAMQRSTLGSILKNHTDLTELWEFLVYIVNDTEVKARIIGVQAIMNEVI